MVEYKSLTDAQCTAISRLITRRGCPHNAAFPPRCSELQGLRYGSIYYFGRHKLANCYGSPQNGY